MCIWCQCNIESPRDLHNAELVLIFNAVLKSRLNLTVILTESWDGIGKKEVCVRTITPYCDLVVAVVVVSSCCVTLVAIMSYDPRCHLCLSPVTASSLPSLNFLLARPVISNRRDFAPSLPRADFGVRGSECISREIVEELLDVFDSGAMLLAVCAECLSLGSGGMCCDNPPPSVLLSPLVAGLGARGLPLCGPYDGLPLRPSVECNVGRDISRCSSTSCCHSGSSLLSGSCAFSALRRHSWVAL